MKVRVVAAKGVRPGDYLWARTLGVPRWSGRGFWIRVVKVERTRPDAVEITTTDWMTVKHPEEGIAVQREE